MLDSESGVRPFDRIVADAIGQALFLAPILLFAWDVAVIAIGDLI